MDLAESMVAQISGLDNDGGDVGLPRSILRALAYADLFDYPLNIEELHRYQIETAYSMEEIAWQLATNALLREATSYSDGYYCLKGRELVFAARRERARASARVWRRARLYCKLIARLPFVRMVAVTGALAVDNISSRPDIDLLVVTQAGRVWICRRLIIGYVRLARLFHDDLCPNYIISENNLNLEQRDLFTAHELVQMAPLHGIKLYRKMIEQNEWVRDYLSAAFGEKTDGARVEAVRRGVFQRALECVLSLSIFDGWERWEMKRLRRKLRSLIGEAAEVVCSPTQCKGHTGLHRQWVTTRYRQRLRELGLDLPE